MMSELCVLMDRYCWPCIISVLLYRAGTVFRLEHCPSRPVELMLCPCGLERRVGYVHLGYVPRYSLYAWGGAPSSPDSTSITFPVVVY